MTNDESQNTQAPEMNDESSKLRWTTLAKREARIGAQGWVQVVLREAVSDESEVAGATLRVVIIQRGWTKKNGEDVVESRLTMPEDAAKLLGFL